MDKKELARMPEIEYPKPWVPPTVEDLMAPQEPQTRSQGTPFVQSPIGGPQYK